MVEIELPCCGTTTHIESSTNAVDCEACGVVLELDVPHRESVPVAA